MKQVAAFTNVEEAEMLCSFLVSSGIRATVRDANTVSVDWRLSNAIGGVKVDVAEHDYNEAMDLIRSLSAENHFHPSTSIRPPARKHSSRRYFVIAAAVSAPIICGIAVTIGFEGHDIPGPLLVISALGIGAGVSGIMALYDW